MVAAPELFALIWKSKYSAAETRDDHGVSQPPAPDTHTTSLHAGTSQTDPDANFHDHLYHIKLLLLVLIYEDNIST